MSITFSTRCELARSGSFSYLMPAESGSIGITRRIIGPGTMVYNVLMSKISRIGDHLPNH
jgi:hypothetical protein